MTNHEFSNHSASTPSSSTSTAILRHLRRCSTALCLVTTLLAVGAVAQDHPGLQTRQPLDPAQPPSTTAQPPSLPSAPQPAAPQKPTQAYAGIVLGTFCGAGASSSSVATKPTVGCGFGGDLLLIPVFFEFGIMGPQANRSYLSGYMSIDAKIPVRNIDSKYLPVLIGGYTRFFETGHALDYGVALAIPRKPADSEGHSLQIELRDYWTFANPDQHNVMLRVGWLVGASD